MRRISHLVAAGLLLGLGLPLAAMADVDRASLIRLAPSVLKIEAVSPSGGFQLGSGVIVGPGKVVTNCHVTRNAERVQVVKGGVRWTATLQAADMLRDLCLLRVPRLEGEPVPIARAATLQPGQQVLAMGYTGGVGIQLSEGDVVALHRWSGSQIVQSSNWFSSGASGGGLFNADGALVGILTFRLRGGARHYFAAPADWVLAQLNDELPYNAVAPLPGKSFWEQPDAEQPYFLQAAALEQSQRWTALAELAERWQQEIGDDPEAPYVLGVAFEALHQPEPSIRAFRRSVEIDPNYDRSWARLAQAYKRQGQLRESRHAVARLATLDPKQARELAAELEKP
ncbi:MAG: tetratricopeptide repeat-containing serine protease family protein [Methylibium sp.]|nr:tetratricopeptide repeat-containing serine protease family protein [Methylibium sp.]